MVGYGLFHVEVVPDARLDVGDNIGGVIQILPAVGEFSRIYLNYGVEFVR